MSSFMVNNRTLNILANYIAQNEPIETNYAFHYERGDGKKIYEALRDLNHKALCERYGGEKAQEMWDINEYEYQIFPDVAEWIPQEEIICRLCCFLYQCDEGTIPRDDIYIGLDKLAGSMARDEVIMIYYDEMQQNGWWG